MRAAFCTAPGRFELRATPTPALGPNEVLVRVRNCGVCGSDLHWYHGDLPTPSVCPGHEISGEVAEVGAAVDRVRAGDRVAIEPLVICRECTYCRAGNYQLCERFKLVGLMRDGGFAEVVSVPEYAIYPLPSELDFELGSLTEPAAVCVHAARLGALTVGDRVAVLGAGAIGLLSVLVAKAGGASRVVVAARHRHQAEMASRLGATRVVASVAELRADNGPIDLVIETVGGKADTLNEAIHVVRPGGTVVLLGVFSEPPRCNTLGLLAKEVRLVGSLTYGRFGAQADFDRALRLLADHAPLARELITHRFNLEEIDAAFRTAADKQTGCIKVTVTP